jgi:hypothetical protein
MNLRRYWFIYFIAILFVNTKLFAQSINVGGIFPTVDHSGAISNKLNYSLYYFAAFPLVNLDNPNVSKDSYFHLFYAEQALSFIVDKKFSITGSYVFQRENAVYKNYVNENRFYIQAKYKHSIKKVNLSHRLRFDGRFVQNRITNESPFTHRVRYLLGLDIPISEKNYVTAYEEAFFNTFENANAFYGENWAYAAFGKKLNKTNKIEAGILYVTWKLANENWFNQYYFQLTWISHLNFIKKYE